MSAPLTIGGRVKARLAARGWTLREAVFASMKAMAPVSFGTWQKLTTTDGEAMHFAALRNVATTLAMPLSELLGEDAATSIATVRIRPSPLNPRKTFEPADIATLGESLLRHGQLQPIIVRPAGEDYEIVVGEKRWRAATQAKIATLRAIVRPVDDAELLALAITENCQRADMSPLDTADAFLAAKKAGHKPKDIATMAGRGLRVVQEYISVAEHLCDRGRELVKAGDLSISQAIALAGERDAKQQASDAAWADINKAGEDAIRARISARKEAAAAPLFGDAAPPAAPPQAIEWPKPDARGIYDRNLADQWSFERKRLVEGRIYTLQIEPGWWAGTIAATTLPVPWGETRIIKADRTWPSQRHATRWLASDAVELLMDGFGRCPKGGTRAKLAEALFDLFGAFGKRIVELGGEPAATAVIVENWRDRLARAIADAAPEPEPADTGGDDGEKEEGPAANWHDGQTFVLARGDARPVVFRSLDAVRYWLGQYHGFVKATMPAIDDMEQWINDEETDEITRFDIGAQGLTLYIADDGR